MKKIEAIIKPFKLDEVKDALSAIGLEGVTISEVKVSPYRRLAGVPFDASETHRDFSSKFKVEVVVPDSRSELVMDTILHAARTGRIGDGKVFVLPLHDAIRIRTNESGDCAL